MASPTAPLKPGRFILRTVPVLHSAARASGPSLNVYCAQKLAAVDPDIASDEDVTSLIGRARTVAGDALSAVVLHGSWVRGEATSASDVDALIVVDNRLALSRALYRAWDAQPITWGGWRVDQHFVHCPSEGKFSGLWAEVALDGIVLFEHDGKLSAHLSRIRREIATGRLVRRMVHGQPYWVEAA